MLFFVRVNQVLLRLWTRVIEIGPWGNSLWVCAWVGGGPVVRPIVLTGLVARTLECIAFELSGASFGRTASGQRRVNDFIQPDAG